MFNRCPFPLFRFLGFCFIICGTIALGDLGGICASPVCLSLSLLQCSVESVKQLVPPLPPRSLSRTHAHTRTHTRAGPTALVVCSHSGQCLATGHARRRPDQHPAHVRNVPSAVQPGGGRGRRGRAGGRGGGGGVGSRLRGRANGGRGRGHLIRATGKEKQLQPSYSSSQRRCSQLGGGGGGRGRWGCGAARASWGSEMLLPQFVRHYGAGT